MLGRNIAFPILNEDGTSFNGLVLHKATVDSVVMSLGDKITGDVYYKDNTLRVTMHEYIEYKQNVDDENEEPVKYILVSPPTIVREGMASDNSELKGMTKYSFEFYHPMYQLSNMPFTDIAVTSNEEKYLSQNKNFSWIGYPSDYIAKLNKNLQWSEWVVVKSTRFPSDKETTLSGVLTFSDNTIADALKTAYDTWGVPYVISQIKSGEQYYSEGKRFMITFGLPTNEIYESENDRNNNNPYIFKMGKGVGLKNNSRTPRKNKIVTRIAGYGSEDNIPYGYPQIVWTGNQDWDYTIDNDSTNPNSYPIYKGIVSGAYVKLIKHPFTRTHLMPSVYSETVNKKVNPNASGYDPTIEIKDYYDAIGNDYPNPINTLAPSYDIHEFNDIKPELGQETITGAQPINDDRTIASDWDDSINDNGEYVQGYFQVTLPILDFDIYACAAITQQMQINMRSGACIGCTFTVQVDWDDYRENFYTQEGEFSPYGTQRDYTKYPNSSATSVTLILQKETQTFGTLMPNIYQKPQSGDEFVILGISMPLSYITNAETRLDNAMLSYMLENNIHYYDYPLKFDEYFLATHTNILEQIHPNSIIHFQYGNGTLELFVKQLTIKYGQGVLPQYDITLTDNVEVVLNQIGQVADSVEHLSTLISILRQGYNQNFFFELAKKLSKTGDDTASGLITFLRGLTSHGQANLLGGAQFGASGGWTINSNGNANLNEIIANLITATQIDAGKINAEVLNAKAAHFAQLIIDELRSAGGAYLLSAADCTIDYVEKLNSSKNVITSGTTAYYRCYYKANDNERAIAQKFVVGDQVMHTTYDAADVVDYSSDNGYYWMAVHEVSSEPVLKTLQDGKIYPCHWIDLDANNKSATSNTIPQVDDDVVLLGHQVTSGVTPTQDDLARQYAIYITAYSNSFDTEVQPPAIVFYQNINSFDLSAANGKKPNYWGRDKVVITGNLKYSSSGSGTGTDVQDLINAGGASTTAVYQLEVSRVVVKADKDGVTDEHVYLRVKKSQGGSVTYVNDTDYTFSIANSIETIVDKSGYRVNLNPLNIVTQRTTGSATDGQRGISSTATNWLFADDTTIIVTLKDGNTILDRQSITLVKDGQDGQDGSGADQYAFYFEQDTQKVTCRGSSTSQTISPASLTYTVKLKINGEETSAASYISAGSGMNCSVAVSGATVTLSNLGSIDKTVGGSATILCYTDTAKTKLWGVLTAKFNVSWSSFAFHIVDNELTSKAQELESDYNGKINSANTRITQNANKIEANAERIDTNETNIANLQIQADGISANVASQKYNSNLFGFTNGLSFTGTCVPFIQAYGVEFAGTGTGYISGFGGVSMDSVTVSGFIRSMGGNTTATVYVNGTTATTIDVTTSWTEFKFSFSGTTSTPLTALNSISLRHTTSGVSTVAVKNLKVESGSIATSFCISDSDGTKIEGDNMFTTTTNYNGDPIFNQLGSNEILDTSNTEGHGSVMRFYRNNNSDPFMAYNNYDWDNTQYAKVLTAGKVYTISFWARSAQDGLKIHTGIYSYVTASGSSSGNEYNKHNSAAVYTDKTTDGIYDNAGGECIHTLTTSWKRYYAHFYIMTGVTSAPIIQCNNGLLIGTTTSKYVYIADVRMEEGYIADESDPMSISGAQTRSEAKFNMTADEIELKLNNTGIDIENNHITLDAEKTTVRGELLANKVRTNDKGSGYIDMTNGLMNVFNSNGINQLRFGVDENGNILLRYYKADGSVAWDLGPSGLQDSVSQDERVVTYTWCLMKEWNGSSWVEGPDTLDEPSGIDILESFYSKRQNGSSVSYLAYLINNGIQSGNGTAWQYEAKINAGQYIGGTGKRAISNEAARKYDKIFLKKVPTSSDPLTLSGSDGTTGDTTSEWYADFVRIKKIEVWRTYDMGAMITYKNGKSYVVPNEYAEGLNGFDVDWEVDTANGTYNDPPVCFYCQHYEYGVLKEDMPFWINSSQIEGL